MCKVAAKIEGRCRNGGRDTAGTFGAGFTLIELLIAMTLAGLVLAGLYSGLRLGLRASETAERRAAVNQELRAVLGFIRRQLDQIYPLLHERQGEREVLFRGERQALYYVVVSPVRGELGGPYIAGIELRRSPQGQQLVYRYWPARPDLEDPLRPPLDAPEKVLIEGVDEVAFGYYGRQGGVMAWHETWNEPLALPRRLRLRLGRHRAGDWPEVLVPTRVDVDEDAPQLVLQPPVSEDQGDLGDEDPTEFGARGSDEGLSDPYQ